MLKKTKLLLTNFVESGPVKILGIILVGFPPIIVLRE